MGFGTLFIGYFLLLNLTYYAFTDLIAALIMAMALNKLSAVEKNFKPALYFSIVFAIIGLAELIEKIYTMFLGVSSNPLFISYVNLPKQIIIAFTTVFILRAISSLANEVELNTLARRTGISVPITLSIYTVLAILDLPMLDLLIDIKILSVITVLAIFAVFVLVIINLTLIFSAYMNICMPEDDGDFEEKPSKFAFVNKFRAHSEQRKQEYVEYKLEKIKKRSSKGKKKK